MSLLYVIRHGQASFGQANYDQLSELGRRQAAIAGAYLQERGVRLDAAYCGTMSRQRDTARIALAQMEAPPEIEVIPSLNEYSSEEIMQALLPAMLEEEPSLGELVPVMRSDRKAFQTLYEGTMLRWITGRYDSGACESWAGFQGRLGRAIEQVRAAHQGGRRVALFTSGGPISGVMRLALELTDEVALRITWVIRNASISTFLFNQKSLTLSAFNRIGHLERRDEPGLLTYR